MTAHRSSGSLSLRPQGLDECRDIVLEQREVVPRAGHAVDRSSEQHERDAELSRHELRGVLRLVGLVQDGAHLRLAACRDQPGKMRWTWRNTGFGLDEIDDI